MSLSDETLHERYGALPLLEGIERMIEDAVDTHIIMERVRKFGSLRYRNGYSEGGRDEHSRGQNRPGFGDMGG